nr:hypothetical protein Iba_chr13dCG4210 [Ipomoea batatas]
MLVFRDVTEFSGSPSRKGLLCLCSRPVKFQLGVHRIILLFSPEGNAERFSANLELRLRGFLFSCLADCEEQLCNKGQSEPAFFVFIGLGQSGDYTIDECKCGAFVESYA